MRAAVIDASCAVGLLTSRLGFQGSALSDYDVHHAPSHIDIECVNALRGMMLGRQLTPEEFVDIAVAVPSIPVVRHSIASLIPRVTTLAPNATAYDAAYIALAELLDAELLTTDERIARIPGITCTVRVL